MLTVSRKARERIFIGDDIVVVVRRTDRGKVSIGVHAPDGVKILREEIAPPELLAKHEAHKG